MATVDDTSSPPILDPPPRLPSETVSAATHDFAEKFKTLEEYSLLPWIDYAVEQALVARRTIEGTVNEAIDVTKSRVDRIRTTSSAHFNQTLGQLQDARSEFDKYEDYAVQKIKEGVHVAASNPLITAGCILGVGILCLKKPRRFLYYNIRRRFMSEEMLISRADAKVKDLRQLLEVFKAEAAKLEQAASQAEDEMMRGRTKLRQAGKQIQGVVRSAYKIERKASGLKDVLEELPRIEASRFRSQVSTLAKEVKKEKKVLTKEINKISNYGISV